MSPDTLSALTDPRSFYEVEATDPSTVEPMVVVLLTALITGGGTAYAVWSMMVLRQSAELATKMANAGIAGMLDFATIAVGWLLYGLAFYLLSNFRGGGGAPPGQTLMLVGYGYLPQLLWVIVDTVAKIFALPAVLPTEMTTGDLPIVRQQLAAHPVVLAATGFGILTLLWSGHLWSIAMEEGRNLSRRDALIVVAIPLAVGLALRIQGLLTTIGGG